VNGMNKNVGVGRSLSMLCITQKIISSYYRSSKFIHVFINYNIHLDNLRHVPSVWCLKAY